MNARKCEDLKLKRALRGMLRVQPSFRSNHLISKGGFTKCNENVKWITMDNGWATVESDWEQEKCFAKATGENENAFDRVQRCAAGRCTFSSCISTHGKVPADEPLGSCQPPSAQQSLTSRAPVPLSSVLSLYDRYLIPVDFS